MAEIPVEQKIALTGGVDFWHTNAVPAAGLPSVMLTDGPHGVRKQAGEADQVGLNESVPATCFPPAVALSSTWDTELLEQVGAALGDETRALQVAVILGPGANIKRDPRCGRNFEYFSEDPFLTGELASAFVKGVQSQGVGTSLKHFACNNQETDRMRRDSQVDMRTLREVYLRGFQKVVETAQPWTVMCSYNKVNGVQASENHWLLTEVLKDEWGFQGVVVSDWGAVWDRVAALRAGLDLEMPSNQHHEDAALAAARSGELDEGTIDAAYERVAAMVHRGAETLAGAPTTFDVDAHHAVARRAAERAVVLLANDGVLPLAPAAKVAVIGEFARTPRYQGAGSSRVNPTRLDNTLDAINAIAGHEVPFAPGFTTAPGQQLDGDPAADAVAIAREAEVVLVFLGLGEAHESEGYDRADIDLPREQRDLLDRVLEVNDNVVVVLSNGSSVALPFADRVRAVVEGWLLGQAGGPVLADVLYGNLNPSGRLSETIPLQLTDCPSYLNFPGDATGVRYGEGIFVGYRGYDQLHREVAFPFGHGLSYSTFTYGPAEAHVDGDTLTVSLEVTNTSGPAGREVVQVYVGKDDSAVVRAPRELKGFVGLELQPGQTERVEVAIPVRELAYWSVLDDAWVVEGGEYTVGVGASSRDLRSTTTVQLDGDAPQRRLEMASTMAEAMSADDQLGRRLQEMASAVFGDLSQGSAGEDALGTDMARMVADMPLASIAGFTGQRPEDVQQLIDEANQRRGL